MAAHLLDPRRLPADLHDAWERFREADPLYASPFYSPAFARAVASGRDDARVAVLENAGEVIGFLPLHITRGGIGKPIGGPINDYHGPILAPGQVLKPAWLLTAAGIAAYDFNHWPVALEPGAQTRGAPGMSPQMELARGYDACVTAKGSAWTKAAREIRRRWRKTEELYGPIRFTYHDPSDTAYAAHVELKNALYQRLKVRSSLGQGWVGTVLDTIRQTQEPGFAGIMSTLHAGDRLIAAHFGMRSRSVWHWWFPSYALALAKLAPGIALVNECAKVAQAHGLETIDFGRGNEGFKQLFGDRNVVLCEGSLARQGSLAAATRRVAGGAVELAERLPLGRFETIPARAAARLVYGVNLP